MANLSCPEVISAFSKILTAGLSGNCVANSTANESGTSSESAIFTAESTNTEDGISSASFSFFKNSYLCSESLYCFNSSKICSDICSSDTSCSSS